MSYVLSLNLHRRHLSTAQRSMVAARVRPHFEKLAKERQREHGGTAPGRDKNTSAQKSRSDEDCHKSLASEQAGAALNVSRQSVDRARTVIEHGTPELVKHYWRSVTTGCTRRDYETFVDYCKERWGFSDSRARQLIASVKTSESVTNVTLPNEAVARELEAGMGTIAPQSCQPRLTKTLPVMLPEVIKAMATTGSGNFTGPY